MIKRSIDIFFSVAILLLFAPFLFIVALLICRSLGRPILFSQIRPGKLEQPFRMFKFRTMVDARSADGELLPDGERLLPIGRWLRATSIDEIPALWNVIKGEMSLVGPRPLLMEYLPLYTPEQARRHEVQPGITGWAQINGRNTISWDEKFALDLWYVEHRSLKLDLTILWRTIAKVIKQDGISANGEATMAKFSGNP